MKFKKFNQTMQKIKFYPIFTIRSNFTAGGPKWWLLCYLLYLLLRWNLFHHMFKEVKILRPFIWRYLNDVVNFEKVG